MKATSLCAHLLFLEMVKHLVVVLQEDAAIPTMTGICFTQMSFLYSVTSFCIYNNFSLQCQIIM